MSSHSLELCENILSVKHIRNRWRWQTYTYSLMCSWQSGPWITTCKQCVRRRRNRGAWRIIPWHLCGHITGRLLHPVWESWSYHGDVKSDRAVRYESYLPGGRARGARLARLSRGGGQVEVVNCRCQLSAQPWQTKSHLSEFKPTSTFFNICAQSWCIHS